ncbi:MAG: RNA-binding protein [Anaerolineaceae bacterium]|jgi:RNA recognition motif-containing protein|nr:MAG: RNA-binding protein [Anaerolineaceae bacterium]
MEYKLYVGNLAYSVTEEDLQTLFAQAGAVKSVALIKERDTGRSKGFAFVEMGNEQDMQNAISLLNGRDFQDRPLTINIARPREERGGFGGGNRGGYSNDRKRKPKGGSRGRSW